MAKNKKIIAIVASLSCVAAIAIGTLIGANAYFVDKTNENTTGTAGEVEIAPEQISINNVSAYITGNGVDIDMGRYMTTGKPIEGSDGWIPEGGGSISVYTPTWYATFHKDDSGYLVKQTDGTFVCDDCGTNVGAYDSSIMVQTYLYPDFFRTKDGKVAYCMDNGKIEPSDGVCNMSTAVTDKIKRILMKGYPQTKGNEYGISDAELEWCTQMALYIVEGTAYDTNGVLYPGDEMTLNDFGTYYTYPDENKEQAEKLLDVIKTLVNYSTDGTVEVVNYTINASQVSTETVDGGSLVGPYVIDTNISSPITLTSDVADVTFRGSDKTTTITTVDGNTEFYAFVPSNVNDDIKITAEAIGTNMVPSYYYWSGRNEEQKMVVASTMPAKVTANIKAVDELMPGDVIDISWVVENIGNKSALTRNTVYIFWDYDENVTDANGLESTYLYKQNTSTSDIRTDMLTGTPSSANLIDVGSAQTFTINGIEHTGYKFTVNGDDIDGVGTAAETGISREIDYGSEYDDNCAYKDVVSYKLALSQWANINTSGQKLKIVVITEAMQYQNTVDDDWKQVGYAEAVIGN